MSNRATSGFRHAALAAIACAVLALSAALPAAAQAPTAPVPGAFQFSNGVHPTFDATFEGATANEVSAFWRNELKGVSMKVANKKEITGIAARIPSATPDTLRILVAVEKHKGATGATAHIAFFTTSGYVGPDSPEREVDGCREWVRQRMVALKRQLAQAELERGQRQLALLERQLDMLGREKQRAERSIQRSQQRSAQAAADRAAAEAQLEALASAPVATAPDSTARAAADQEGQKERRKLEDRVKRGAHQAQAMAKKVEDLQWTVKKNGEDQAAKQAEIGRQKEAVSALQEAFRAIN